MPNNNNNISIFVNLIIYVDNGINDSEVHFNSAAIFRARALMTRRTAWITVIIISSLSACINVPTFFMNELRTPENSTVTICTIVQHKYQTYIYLGPYIYMVLYSLMPSMIIATCNVIIIYSLIKRRNMATTNTHGDTTLQKAIYKIIPMVLLVSIVFIMCTMPLSVYYIGMYL